jgi:D-beta-D-heptose 7-phosphate kinase / D-beta-D-heptose 1-phosphate adenosyltransferase
MGREWHGLTVVVVGDVMLDRFVYGRVDRVSPEAPIPILHHLSEKEMLGGAGNVARNIAALGGRAILVGALGNDREGDLIAGPLAKNDRICARFIRVRGQPTTTKVRFISGAQQIMRLDVERQFELTARDVDALCESLDQAQDVSAVVLSDYAKGVIVPALVRRVVEIARGRGIPVVVDPKSRNVERMPARQSSPPMRLRRRR